MHQNKHIGTWNDELNTTILKETNNKIKHFIFLCKILSNTLI